MAPRTTRPHSRSSALVTRKRGESDPNDPPKKRKTRHSKPDSDEMEVDERGGGTAEVKRGEGKSGRRAKKAGRYVPLFPPFFFFFRFSYSFLLITFAFVSIFSNADRLQF